jgi:NADPH:quinone reductase-like Zn-dependent oxidoreductase
MKNKQAIINEFGLPSVIRIVENEMPQPKPNEARIKIEASTVSATDIFIRKGIYPLLKQKPPFTLGYDFVGIVDAIGADVKNVKIGDRVCNIIMIGGNANYMCCKADELILIPSEVEAKDAACFTLSGITAYQIFKHIAKVKNGNSILIHGASGAVGNMLLQLGKINNCKMIATASASKHLKIESYGAKALDYHSINYFTQLKQFAENGFDAVFDFTNQKSFNQSFGLLKNGGTLVTYAVYSSSLRIDKKTTFNFLKFGMDFGLMMMKLFWWNTFSNKSAKFFGVMDSKKDFPERFRNDMSELFELLKQNKVKPLIYKELPLEDVQEAHQLIQDRKVEGQIVILNN